MRRILCVLLILVLLLSFPSCGREVHSSSSESPTNQVGTEIDNSDTITDFTENTDIYENAGAVFSRELLLFPDYDVLLTDAVKTGNRKFMYGTETGKEH